MNPFLLPLLGQQSAPQINVGSDGIPEMILTGKAPTPTEPPDYSAASGPNAEAVRNRAQDVAKTEEASQRRGLFGMKGTLRDVLGVIGDAFLIQSGRGPMYAPVRQQERISDAWAGATAGDEAYRQATERVGYYDVAKAQEMLEKGEISRLREAQQKSLADSREDMALNREAGRYDKARPALTALFNQPGAYLEDGSINPAALQMAERIASRYGFSLEDFVNDNMTAEEAKLFAGSGPSVYQQERLIDADRTADQRDFSNQSGRISANASMIRANKPPAGRSSNPNETVVLQGIQRKIDAGQPLNRGEQEFWDSRVTRRNQSSGGRSTRQVPTTSRFRPVSN